MCGRRGEEGTAQETEQEERGGTTTGRFVGCVDITMTGEVAMCELDGELGGRDRKSVV